MNRAAITVIVMAGVVCLVGLAGVSHADIPRTISYQGKVTDTAGNPVADGTYTMRFWIYDAETAGNVEWDSGARQVALNDGVFNVLLGESPQPALDLSFDEDYWLLVRFAGVDQTPRQRLTANGYSYMASGLVPGTEVAGDFYVDGKVGIGTTTPGSDLEISNTVEPILTLRGNYGDGSASIRMLEWTTSLGIAMRYDGVDGELQFKDNSTGAQVMTVERGGNVGIGTAAPSTKLHVVDDAGSAIYGQCNATSGTASAIGAYSSAPSGYGVYAIAGAYQGTTYGVYGKSSSKTNGHGVYGYASATCGTNYGVYGVSASSEQSYGVYGEASATTPANDMTYGVYGKSRSPLGTGVYGIASASTGWTYGGFFGNHSPYGIGVKGFAAATTQGESYGGWFSSNGPQGIGVYACGGVEGYAGVFRGNVAVKSYTSGSIVLELGEGLDYAEGFDVSDGDAVGPGTVLIIDEANTGKLSRSHQPYDTRVAGIVAGANGIGSGVRLGAGEFDQNVALAGRVYCNVDATAEGVVPGDLLTTSPMPGHAMKATDLARAQGAILGKAMEPLSRGHKGQILVLVTLQ